MAWCMQVRRPIRGGMILVDKVSMGVSNSLLTQPGPTNRTSVCDADWTEGTRPRKYVPPSCSLEGTA